MLRRAVQHLGSAAVLRGAPSPSCVLDAGSSVAGRLSALPCTRELHSGAAALAKAPAAGAGAKKAKKEGGRSTATGQFDPNVATGCNIVKGGTDPKFGKDEEYPEWLWKLAEPRPVLSALEKKGIETLSLEEGVRWMKLSRKKQIKDANAASGA